MKGIFDTRVNWTIHSILLRISPMKLLEKLIWKHFLYFQEICRSLRYMNWEKWTFWLIINLFLRNIIDYNLKLQKTISFNYVRIFARFNVLDQNLRLASLWERVDTVLWYIALTLFVLSFKSIIPILRECIHNSHSADY